MNERDRGALLIRTTPLERDTNQNRDVHAGWLVKNIDLAASSMAGRLSCGRTATVSISQLDFISPVRVGSEVSFYGRVEKVGNSPIHIQMEVWTRDAHSPNERKVTETTLVMVAIDEHGRIRRLPQQP